MSQHQENHPQAPVLSWLEQFEEANDPGPLGVPWTHHRPGSPGAPHLVMGVIVHGNENGTLPAALRLQAELIAGELTTECSVTILLGNPEAARANVRFVDEDFNRVMTFDRVADNIERRRADEVRPLLDAADFFLDIHQTQTPTESAFWTFPWELDLGLWARALGAAPIGLTRAGGGSFSQGKCCLDEYIRARGKVGITVEVGEKGEDDGQAERAYQCMVRAIEIHGALSRGQTLRELAEQRDAVAWYETLDIVRAETQEHRLRAGIGNFTRVESGELLSAPDAPEIRASATGCILFPKYPAPGDPPPPELFRLGVPVDDPDARYGG